MQNADLTEYLKTKTIKKGKTVRAKGADFYYAISKDKIRQITSSPKNGARHMGTRDDGKYWETKNRSGDS